MARTPSQPSMLPAAPDAVVLTETPRWDLDLERAILAAADARTKLDGIVSVDYCRSVLLPEGGTAELALERVRAMVIESGTVARHHDGEVEYRASFVAVSAEFSVTVWAGSDADQAFAQAFVGNAGWRGGPLVEVTR